MKTETNNLRLQYAQPESYEIKVRARKMICTSPTEYTQGGGGYYDDDNTNNNGEY